MKINILLLACCAWYLPVYTAAVDLNIPIPTIKLVTQRVTPSIQTLTVNFSSGLTAILQCYTDQVSGLFTLMERQNRYSGYIDNDGERTYLPGKEAQKYYYGALPLAKSQ